MRISLQVPTRFIAVGLAYLLRKERVSYLPYFLGVETSGICNLHCEICPHGLPTQRQRGLMSLDVFKRVIDEAKDYVSEADLFGGGEPLLQPRIFEMIRYAHRNGIRTRIHTNATKLTDEAILELLTCGLDFLSLSIDGYDKESYERRRVNANYETTLRGTMRLLEKRRQMNATRPYTVVQAVVNVANDEHGLDGARARLTSMFAKLPVNEVKVIPQHNYGGKVGSGGDERRNHTPCTFPWYSVFVLWDGTIVPCCLDWWGEFSLGNIASTSLREAWYSDKLAELRHALATGNVEGISLCAKCDRLRQRSFLGVPASSVRSVRSFLRL